MNDKKTMKNQEFDVSTVETVVFDDLPPHLEDTELYSGGFGGGSMQED